MCGSLSELLRQVLPQSGSQQAQIQGTADFIQETCETCHGQQLILEQRLQCQKEFRRIISQKTGEKMHNRSLSAVTQRTHFHSQMAAFRNRCGCCVSVAVPLRFIMLKSCPMAKETDLGTKEDPHGNQN